MAKKGTQQKKYSTEFKIGVITDMREHHLGYNETILQQRQNFHKTKRNESGAIPNSFQSKLIIIFV